MASKADTCCELKLHQTSAVSCMSSGRHCHVRPTCRVAQLHFDTSRYVLCSIGYTHSHSDSVFFSFVNDGQHGAAVNAVTIASHSAFTGWSLLDTSRFHGGSREHCLVYHSSHLLAGFLVSRFVTLYSGKL